MNLGTTPSARYAIIRKTPGTCSSALSAEDYAILFAPLRVEKPWKSLQIRLLRIPEVYFKANTIQCKDDPRLSQPG
jgi:hypothetical protein